VVKRELTLLAVFLAVSVLGRAVELVYVYGLFAEEEGQINFFGMLQKRHEAERLLAWTCVYLAFGALRLCLAASGREKRSKPESSDFRRV